MSNQELEYKKLCEEIKFKNSRVILVSGPQRAGTRFTAKSIAKELGYEYIDEVDFSIEREDRFLLAFENADKAVIHCPAMCHLLQNVGDDDVSIVFCHRKLEDIYASQKRINWSCEKREKDKYKPLLDQHTLVMNPIAEVKIAYWEGMQKAQIKNTFDSKYEWWRQHPDFITKDERTNFHPSQTK